MVGKVKNGSSVSVGQSQGPGNKTLDKVRIGGNVFALNRKVTELVGDLLINLGRSLRPLKKVFSSINKRINNRSVQESGADNTFSLKKGSRSITNKDLVILAEAVEKAKGAANEGEAVSLKEVMRNIGFASTFEGVDFSKSRAFGKKAMGPGDTPVIGTEVFSGLDFSGCKFNRCKFDQVRMDDCILDKVTFIKCSADRTVFSNSKFNEVKFDRCNMNSVQMNECDIGSTNFENCSLEYGNFDHATMRNVELDSCNLQQACFWQSSHRNVKIKYADDNGQDMLRDALFFESEIDFIGVTPEKPKKPVVTLMWDPRHPGLTATRVFDRLRENGLIPMRISYTPSWSDKNELSSELSAFMRSEKLTDDESLGEAIIRSCRDEGNNQATKLKDEAKKLAESVDGIVFPGGANIETAFYQKDDGSIEQLKDADARRTVLEFAMMESSRNKGLPVLGMCRALQMVNVYDGGTLSDVKGQFAKIHRYHVDVAGEAKKSDSGKTTFYANTDVVEETASWDTSVQTLGRKFYLSNVVSFNDQVATELEEELRRNGFDANYDYSMSDKKKAAGEEALYGALVLRNVKYLGGKDRDAASALLESILKKFGDVKSKKDKQADGKVRAGAGGILRGALGEEVGTVSAHGQMVDQKAEKHLEYVVTERMKNGTKVPKAAESKHGAPQVFTQFHPEFRGGGSSIADKAIDKMMTSNNDNIFISFADAANTAKNKKVFVSSLSSSSEPFSSRVDHHEGLQKTPKSTPNLKDGVKESGITQDMIRSQLERLRKVKGDDDKSL